MKREFYNFTTETLQGKKVAMDDYKGKVVLIVNTASKCGFTPQYKGLEELWQTYKDRGLVILGFPCNQFANQEPGDVTTTEGCLLNFGVTFPVSAKIDVNGDTAHPLFKYLRSELKGLGGDKIKWNFTKFLIDTEGRPVKRFAPAVKPENLVKDIEKLLP